MVVIWSWVAVVGGGDTRSDSESDLEVELLNLLVDCSVMWEKELKDSSLSAEILDWAMGRMMLPLNGDEDD